MRTKKYSSRFTGNDAETALQNATSGNTQATKPTNFWNTFMSNPGNSISALANLVGAATGNQPETNIYNVQPTEKSKISASTIIIGVMILAGIVGLFLVLRK